MPPKRIASGRCVGQYCATHAMMPPQASRMMAWMISTGENSLVPYTSVSDTRMWSFSPPGDASSNCVIAHVTNVIVRQ